MDALLPLLFINNFCDSQLLQRPNENRGAMMNLKKYTSRNQFKTTPLTEPPDGELPPKVPALSPTEWLKANLFSNTFNSILTILSTAAILLIVRGLLSFIFNPLRQWSATATNMRLLMTQAYPEHQYARI